MMGFTDGFTPINVVHRPKIFEHVDNEQSVTPPTHFLLVVLMLTKLSISSELPPFLASWKA